MITLQIAGWAMATRIQCPPYLERYAGTLLISLKRRTAVSTAVDVVISKKQAPKGYSTLVTRIEEWVEGLCSQLRTMIQIINTHMAYTHMDEVRMKGPVLILTTLSGQKTGSVGMEDTAAESRGHIEPIPSAAGNLT